MLIHEVRWTYLDECTKLGNKNIILLLFSIFIAVTCLDMACFAFYITYFDALDVVVSLIDEISLCYLLFDAHTVAVNSDCLSATQLD